MVKLPAAARDASTGSGPASRPGGLGESSETDEPSDSSDTSDRNPLPTRLLIGLVRLYQAAHGGRRAVCRYVPTCSEYAAIALYRHGAARGGWLTVRRLCRCHPWGGYGADPVPERSGVRNPS